MRTFSAFTKVTLAWVAAAATVQVQAQHRHGVTQRISIVDGIEADAWSGAAVVSADGRLVAFRSGASNLVADDTNGAVDVFVGDRTTRAVTRVSVSSSGEQADAGCGNCSISADGQLVAFSSEATNLVTDDGNGVEDVFVHDRRTGLTVRTSIHSSGEEGNGESSFPAISGDGRFVAFQSRATNLVRGKTFVQQIFVHDLHRSRTELLSVSSSGEYANDYSHRPSLSADGRYASFSSSADNLIENDTNDTKDVFVRDRLTGETLRVSLSSTGEAANGECSDADITDDGRYVAFESWADNLVEGDTNDTKDVFVHDRQTGRTTRVSVASDGEQASSYSSARANHVLTSDGRYAIFESPARNLREDLPIDPGALIFRHDRQTGETLCVSRNAYGEIANDECTNPAFSADGRWIAFDSTATNLVDGDTTYWWPDVFIHHPGPLKLPPAR